MRPMTMTLATALVAALAAILLVPGAAAQGCDQASACPLAVSVNEAGFTDVSVDNFTVGDWYEIDFSNEGDMPHTIMIPGYSVSVALALDETQTKTMQFATLGCFEMKDSPSGAIHKLRVVTADSYDFSTHVSTEKDPCIQTIGGTGGPAGSTSSSAKAPGLELPLLALAVAAVAMMMRRRT